MTNTFSVMHPSSGEAIDTGLSLADAVDVKLSFDGQQWDIRNAGDCWQLWCKRLNMPWRATVIFSIEETEAAARADIIQQVAAAHWEREPYILSAEIKQSFPPVDIFCRAPDGTVFRAFTWTRDAASGVARAWTDARLHGVEIVDAWAEAANVD